jgi:hypothetical protein
MDRYEPYKKDDKIRMVSSKDGETFDYELPLPEFAHVSVIEGLKNGAPSGSIMTKSESASTPLMSVVSTAPVEIWSINLDPTQSYYVMATVRYKTNNSNTFGKFALSQFKNGEKLYDNGGDFEAVAVGDTSIRGTTPLPKCKTLSMNIDNADSFTLECAVTRNGLLEVLAYSMIAIKISK